MLYGTYWAQGWEGYNWLSPTPITNHSDTSQKVDYWRGVGGIRGDFGKLPEGWSYDAYVQYSHNKGIYKTEQFLQEIYDISYFQTASCVGTTLPISGKQCMDLPWLDPSSSLDCSRPLKRTSCSTGKPGRRSTSSLAAKHPLPATCSTCPPGPLGVALGATVRRDEIEDTPGEITLAGNAWGATAGGITAGHSITKELFGEIQVPILKGRSFFKDLSFSGAARLTNVKSVQRDPRVTDKDNGNITYKLGGNWAVNDWLRFRGTYGTSFRAPALFEQFKANETSFISARNIDPCVRVNQNLAQGNISPLVA